MDKINFLASDSFPLSSETMSMMQNMTALVAKLALLGGNNYILEGCTENNNIVAPGVLVINGEIIVFQGGAKKEKIKIIETRKSVSAFGSTYNEAYIYQIAEFADVGEYNWSDFSKILTNQQLEDKFKALKEESTGFIKMWSGRIDRIPDGYLLCNGDTVTSAQYPELAYSLGKETEGSFMLPDLRRRFIVGYDNSVDSGYSQMWDTGGSETITLTESQMPKHTHDVEFVDEKWGDNANSRPFPNPAGTSGYSAQTTSAGGGEAHENRPPYYVLAYVIKVK